MPDLARIVLVSLLWVACFTLPAQADAQDVSTKPLIFAASYPLGYFAERLAGDRFEVRVAPRSEDGWRPTVEEILAMQSSVLVLIADRNRESWLDRVTLGEEKIVDTTANVPDRLMVRQEGVTHSHGPDGTHSHQASEGNPWLDLSLAQAQAEAVGRAIEAVAPDAGTESRLQSLRDDLAVMDARLLQVTGGTSDVSLLTEGRQFTYLARRYGLVFEEVEVNLNDPHGLGRPLGSPSDRWMIWPRPPTPDQQQWIRSQNVSSGTVDPLVNRPVEGDFLAAMQRNIETLEKILGRQ